MKTLLDVTGEKLIPFLSLGALQSRGLLTRLNDNSHAPANTTS